VILSNKVTELNVVEGLEIKVIYTLSAHDT